MTIGKSESAKNSIYTCEKRSRLISDYLKTIDLHISADNKLAGSGKDFRVFNSKVKLNNSEAEKDIKFTITVYRSFIRLRRANIAPEALPETSKLMFTSLFQGNFRTEVFVRDPRH